MMLTADCEILSAKDVADILEVEEQTIDKMAQSGDLPAFKVWGQWRIRRVDFDTWMVDQAATLDEAVDEEG
jgi:excisionase family DNA binding protein